MTAPSFLPGTQIEIWNPDIVRGRIRFALFDFDGTLSVIREGWQQVMIPRMIEILLDQPEAQDEQATLEVVTEFVTRLTGKQTIYQMMALCEEIEKRGGKAEDPLYYKKDYLDLLWVRIRDRVEGLQKGKFKPEDYILPGSFDILDALKTRGATRLLASGTDEPDVKRESALLGVADYFDGGIYGARDDYKSFSKAMVIDRIIKEYNLKNEEIVVFGDGYVEIENVKAVGGIAVGVASDEAARQGIDEWKRDRLTKAGADIIVPDFREAEALVAYLYQD